MHVGHWRPRQALDDANLQLRALGQLAGKNPPVKVSVTACFFTLSASIAVSTVRATTREGDGIGVFYRVGSEAISLSGARLWCQQNRQKRQENNIQRGRMYKEYKIEIVAEGGCGTLLLGSSGLPVKKLEATLNQAAAEGWTLVFQVIEHKRFWLFWTRETVILTLAR